MVNSATICDHTRAPRTQQARGEIFMKILEPEEDSELHMWLRFCILTTVAMTAAAVSLYRSYWLLLDRAQNNVQVTRGYLYECQKQLGEKEANE